MAKYPLLFLLLFCPAWLNTIRNGIAPFVPYVHNAHYVQIAVAPQSKGEAKGAHNIYSIVSQAQRFTNPVDTPPSITCGLLGLWHLDGNTDDASGKGHNGTIVGTVTPTAGRFDQGYHFDGNSYIDCGDIPYSLNNEFTVSAWIKSNAPYVTTIRRIVVSKLAVSVGGPLELYIGDSTAGTAGSFASWQGFTPLCNIESGLDAARNAKDGAWHHLAATIRPDSQVVYFDGVPVARSSTAFTPPNTFSSFRIGGMNFGNYHKPWIGEIDEVALYGYALSPTEIRILAAKQPINPNDVDGDGVANASDNCPGCYNPDQKSRLYRDRDGDGYGERSSWITECPHTYYPPGDYVADSTDCNDNNAAIHPGASEVCGDGTDNNCNGQIDEGCSISTAWKLTGNSDATTSSLLGTTNASALNLSTNNVTQMFIGTTGKVGIGTTSPLTPLHVVGFGSFGNRVTSGNATRALNLADTAAIVKVLRVDPNNAPAVELISRTTADGANVAYWDFYAQPNDASFRIRDRQTGTNIDRVTISHATGNVGIGTVTPNTTALLELSSTAKGMLVPRMTKAQRNAITSPAQGLLVFQTDNTAGFYYYDGGWKLLTGGVATLNSTSLSTSNTTLQQLKEEQQKRRTELTELKRALAELKVDETIKDERKKPK